MDARDLFRGDLTYRRMLVLIRGLPPDSHVGRAVTGEATWGDSEHLLATIADRLGEVVWVTAQVNSTKKIDRPRPLPRPGEVAPQPVRRHASIDEMKRFFGGG